MAITVEYACTVVCSKRFTMVPRFITVAILDQGSTPSFPNGVSRAKTEFEQPSMGLEPAELNKVGRKPNEQRLKYSTGV
jgi:hypothetical protein